VEIVPEKQQETAPQAESVWQNALKTLIIGVVIGLFMLVVFARMFPGSTGGNGYSQQDAQREMYAQQMHAQQMAEFQQKQYNSPCRRVNDNTDDWRYPQNVPSPQQQNRGMMGGAAGGGNNNNAGGWTPDYDQQQRMFQPQYPQYS
jgi:hypothetical protein